MNHHTVYAGYKINMLTSLDRLNAKSSYSQIKITENQLQVHSVTVVTGFLALSFALVPHTLSCSVCEEDS